MPGDEEGNETPEQLRTYFTLNDNLKPVGVRQNIIMVKSLTMIIMMIMIASKMLCVIIDDDYDENDDKQDVIQGQFGGLSLPEVEEDAWSVKDYIE